MAGGQGVIPTVLADRGEERIQRGDAVFLDAVLAGLAGYPDQVALQHRPVDPGQALAEVAGLVEEGAEASQRGQVGQRGGERQTRGQAQPDPAFDQSS